MSSTDRKALLAEADKLGIAHPKNISTKRLAELVSEALAPPPPADLTINTLTPSDPNTLAAIAETANARQVPASNLYEETASERELDHLDERERAELKKATTVGLPVGRNRGTQNQRVDRRNKWEETNGNPPPSRKGVYLTTGWLVESTGELASSGNYICTLYCPKCDHGTIYGDPSHPTGSRCPGRNCIAFIPEVNV